MVTFGYGMQPNLTLVSTPVWQETSLVWQAAQELSQLKVLPVPSCFICSSFSSDLDQYSPQLVGWLVCQVLSNVMQNCMKPCLYNGAKEGHMNLSCESTYKGRARNVMILLHDLVKAFVLFWAFLVCSSSLKKKTPKLSSVFIKTDG